MTGTKNSFRFAISLLLGACSAAAIAGQTPMAGFLSSEDGGPAGLSHPETGGSDSTFDSSEEQLYSKGTRAIQQGQWAEAESIFTKVTERHGDHAEGALYWAAYAENKQGKSEQALGKCATLRSSYPRSRWIDDCSALEIEIHGNSGHPIEPQSEQDENLKLLALNTLMRQDEARALPQIQSILAGNDPEPYKEQALFVLAQSDSLAARQMLRNVASPGADIPDGIRSNPALRQRAQQLIAASRSPEAANPASSHSGLRLGVDAVVTDASGQPVRGLTAGDFTVLDNGHPQKILSVRAIDEPSNSGNASTVNGTGMPPTQVILVIDTMNASVVDVGYERQQVEDYLRQDGGALPYPTTILIFNGKEAVPIGKPSKDGNAVAALLEKAAPNLRIVRRSEGYYGDVERLQRSLSTLSALADSASKQPGKKVLVWLSPGWPLLTNSNAWSTARESRTVFDEIVDLSTSLRQARITLVGIDPGTLRSTGSLEWVQYRGYLKPITKSNDAVVANLALPVIAEQTGGLAISVSDQYLTGQIATAINQIGKGYFISFEVASGKLKNEFHTLTITTAKPGIKVRTRTGYYSQP